MDDDLLYLYQYNHLVLSINTLSYLSLPLSLFLSLSLSLFLSLFLSLTLFLYLTLSLSLSISISLSLSLLSQVASEILSVTDLELKPISFLLDAEDEVMTFISSLLILLFLIFDYILLIILITLINFFISSFSFFCNIFIFIFILNFFLFFFVLQLFFCMFSFFSLKVNIAQFHPIPGNGIVYGTKRGKVKVFYRNNYEVKNDGNIH